MPIKLYDPNNKRLFDPINNQITNIVGNEFRFTKNGKPEEEKMFLYAELTAKKRSESILSVDESNNQLNDRVKDLVLDDFVSVSQSQNEDVVVNFIGYNQDNKNGYFTNQYTDFSSGNPDNMIRQTRYEGFGIRSITLTSQSHFITEVTIKFTDMTMGANLKDTPYSILFSTIPIPIFKLKLKGFYGYIVEYTLIALNVPKVEFDSERASFDIEMKFVSNIWKPLADILVGYIYSSPFLKIGNAGSKIELSSQKAPKNFYEFVMRSKTLYEDFVNLKKADLENTTKDLQTMQTAYKILYQYMTNYKTYIQDRKIEIEKDPNNDFKYKIRTPSNYQIGKELVKIHKKFYEDLLKIYPQIKNENFNDFTLLAELIYNNSEDILNNSPNYEKTTTKTTASNIQAMQTAYDMLKHYGLNFEKYYTEYNVIKITDWEYKITVPANYKIGSDILNNYNTYYNNVKNFYPNLDLHEMKNFTFISELIYNGVEDIYNNQTFEKHNLTPSNTFNDVYILNLNVGKIKTSTGFPKTLLQQKLTVFKTKIDNEKQKPTNPINTTFDEYILNFDQGLFLNSNNIYKNLLKSKISDFKSKLDNQLSLTTQNLTSELNKIVQNRYGQNEDGTNFVPTIKNVFRLICNDVDNFFNILYDVSVKAEAYHKNSPTKVDDGNGGVDGIHSFPIFAVLDNQIKNNTNDILGRLVKRYPNFDENNPNGGSNKNWEEVKFVDDFFRATAYRDISDNKSNISKSSNIDVTANELTDYIANTKHTNIKQEIYYKMKDICDMWIKGSQKTSNTSAYPFLTPDKPNLIDNFIFVDRAYNDIGDECILDVSEILDLDLRTTSIYTLMSKLLSKNGFQFFPFQNFMVFNEESWMDAFEVSENLQIKTTPYFVCMYIGGSSSYTDSNNTHKSDEVDLTTPSTVPPDYKGQTSLYAFRVGYGEQNQSYFKNVKINMTDYRNSWQSVYINDQIGKLGGKNIPIFQGQSMFDVYEARSYSATVKMMGNMMIQPTQHFQLDNIPIFNGLYMITKVNHEMNEDDMITTFEGFRVGRYVKDIVRDFIKSIEVIYEKIEVALEDKDVVEIDEYKPENMRPIVDYIRKDQYVFNKNDFEKAKIDDELTYIKYNPENLSQTVKILLGLRVSFDATNTNEVIRFNSNYDLI